MNKAHSSSPKVALRRSRMKRTIGPAAVLLVAGAVLFGTMGPGSGTELATNTSPSATAPVSATPIAQPAASSLNAPAPSAAPVPGLPAQTTPAQPIPATVPAPTDAILPPSAIDNPAIKAPVKTAVAGFITKNGQISTEKIAAPVPGVSTAPPAAIDFSAVAYGSALGELEAQHQEFASNGWQQSGTVHAVGTAATASTVKDGTEQVSVTVCLDSSSVSVVDNTGATVLAAEKAGTRKNLNTYVVQEVSGAWLVVEHTFPGDSGC